MKRFFVGLIAFFAVASCVTSVVAAPIAGIVDTVADAIRWCVTPTTANAGEDDFIAAKNYLDSVWRAEGNTTGTVDVTYQTMSDLVAQLNMNGLPCQIKQLRGAGVTGYVVMGAGKTSVLDGYGSYSLAGKYFTNTAGAIFRADKGSSSVPSTSAPHISENNSSPGSGSSGGYIPSHFGKNTEKEILQQIAQYTHEIWFWADLINDNLKDVRRYTHMVYANIGRFVDGMNNITTGIYKQIDLLSGYLPRLDDIYNRLFNIQSASWASVDVENRIYSAVAGIDSRLSTVINNGTVQVNTTALEARLDKLISMYAKVNSVVLDTAAINGGQIKDAVGGELKDVMFWGDTAKVDNTFVSSDGVAYSLNDEKTTVNGLTLRSVNLGSTIPAYIANDPVLYAGVWRKGTDYIISDTYNASTGEYVKRIETFTFNRENLQDAWYEIVPRGGSVYLFKLILPIPRCCINGAYDLTYYPHVPFMDGLGWGESTLNIDAFNDSVCVYHVGFVLGVNSSYLADDVFSYLVTRTPAMEMLFVPDPYFGWSPAVQYFDLSTIAIPEGDTTISAKHLRITGKYETYDSYTQTADIINAINNLQLSGGVAADLSAVTTRLDTLIANSTTKVENVTNVVIEETNNAYNVFYVTTDDGDKKPVGEVAGDTLSASGKLLNFLYKLCFEGALSRVDDSITNMDGFYFDSGAGLEGNIWD